MLMDWDRKVWLSMIICDLQKLPGALISKQIIIIPTIHSLENLLGAFNQIQSSLK